MSHRDPVVYVRHMLDHAKEAVEMTRGRNRVDLVEESVQYLSQQNQKGATF